MADSRAHTGKVQDKPGILYSSRKKNAQKIIGTCQKCSVANLKGLPTAISGITNARRYIIITYKIKNPRLHIDVTFKNE